MARENVGEIVCYCGTEQPLRRDKNGFLYIACTKCGLLQFKGAEGQQLLMDKGKLYGGEPKSKPKADDDKTAPRQGTPPARKGPAQPKADEPAPAPPVKNKTSLLDDFL